MSKFFDKLLGFIPAAFKFKKNVVNTEEEFEPPDDSGELKRAIERTPIFKKREGVRTITTPTGIKNTPSGKKKKRIRALQRKDRKYNLKNAA